MRIGGKTEKGNTLAFWLLLAFGIAGICIGGLRSDRFAPRTREAASDSVKTRKFPSVTPPGAISDQAARLVWSAENFWNSFTDTSVFFPGDTTMVNGVLKEDVEEAMGTYATMLGMVPLDVAQRSQGRFFGRISAFQEAHPESGMFQEIVELASKYFYDPNSPVRSEDIYLPFVQRLSQSPLVPEGMRMAYAFDAEMCSQNQTGSVVADFSFTTIAGRKMRLSGIKAENTLLFFSNPGCPACAEIIESLEGSQHVAALISSGRLAVVNVYIDQELDEWRTYAVNYPASWITGYDHSYSIRSGRLYNIRAIPSLYLLDSQKRVILKDATAEKVLAALSAIR